jgi:hypothetical protein
MAMALAGAAQLLAASGARAAVLISDAFNYADGPISQVATPPDWGQHSGLAPQTVVSGRAFIDDANSGDHNRRFTNTTTGSLFAGADVTVSDADVPTTPSTATDGYFFHFSDLGAGQPPTLGTGFRGRVWAVPGTTLGKVRFALSTTSGVANAYTPEFDPGTQHRIVVSYDFSTGLSQLWVDPTGNGVPATITGNVDPTISAGLGAIALRSGNNLQGDVFVDNLIVADSFAEAAAVPEPAALGLLGAVALLGLGRKRRRTRADKNVRATI